MIIVKHGYTLTEYAPITYNYQYQAIPYPVTRTVPLPKMYYTEAGTPVFENPQGTKINQHVYDGTMPAYADMDYNTTVTYYYYGLSMQYVWTSELSGERWAVLRNGSVYRYNGKALYSRIMPKFYMAARGIATRGTNTNVVADIKMIIYGDFSGISLPPNITIDFGLNAIEVVPSTDTRTERLYTVSGGAQ